MPPDAQVDMTPQTDNADSAEVLAAILSPPPADDKKKPEAKQEKPAGDDDASSRAEDAEGDDNPEGDGGEEEEAEEEAEEEKAEKDDGDEEDDLDEYVTDVVVDGKTEEVTLGDLKKNYSGNKFTQAALQQAIETRKIAEAQATTLFEVNKQRHAQLTVLDKIVKLQAEPAIDWEALRKSDPNAYLLKRDEQRVAQEKQAQVQQELRKVNEEQAEIQAQATKRYLDEQAELLVTKLPVLGDAKRAPAHMASLEAGAAKYFGYTSEEFNSITDHRALLILHDAVENRKEKDKLKADKKALNGDTSEKKVLVRPHGHKSSSGASASKRLSQEAINRAKASGKPDDVAATLLIRKKG